MAETIVLMQLNFDGGKNIEIPKGLENAYILPPSTLERDCIRINDHERLALGAAQVYLPMFVHCDDCREKNVVKEGEGCWGLGD